MILNSFEVLMLKINFKNKKNNIFIYFQVKYTLKNNHYYNPKQKWLEFN